MTLFSHLPDSIIAPRAWLWLCHGVLAITGEVANHIGKEGGFWKHIHAASSEPRNSSALSECKGINSHSLANVSTAAVRPTRALPGGAGPEAQGLIGA